MNPESQASAEKSRGRILVAEDEALIRLDLVEMLVEAGYEVVGEASNGEEAIALAEKHKPDLAILDVKMPILDGISAKANPFEFPPPSLTTSTFLTAAILLRWSNTSLSEAS